MAKVMSKVKHLVKEPSDHNTQLGARKFSADEFEADTQEDRSVAVLAEKRRQFLSRLNAKVSHISIED